MPKKRLKDFVPITIVIIAISILFFVPHFRGKRLEENPVLAKGTIVHFKWFLGSSSASVEYVLNEDGQLYSCGLGILPQFAPYLKCLIMNKVFPAVFEKGHPENSEVLLSKGEFKKFNVVIPDTLVAAIDALDYLSGDPIIDPFTIPCGDSTTSAVHR